MILKPHNEEKLLNDLDEASLELARAASNGSIAEVLSSDPFSQNIPLGRSNVLGRPKPHRESQESRNERVERILNENNLGLERVIREAIPLLSAEKEETRFRTVRTLLEMHRAIPKEVPDADRTPVININVMGENTKMMSVLLPERNI